MNHNEIIGMLEENGYRAVFIPYRHLEEVKDEIRHLFKDGSLDPGFYEEWMPTYLDEKLPKSLKSPKSILLAATRAPMRIVKFQFNGHIYELSVPPTYGRGPEIRRRLRSILRRATKSNPLKLVDANPPLKLLAVRSGLAMYGRNNVTYVKGLGSFHRLTAFYTELEVPDENWGKKHALPKCEKCRICLSECPMGAITEDRFLLKAERCLTFMNEKTSDHLFPSWVKPEWHNSIVGCMICQRKCPYDREFISEVEDSESFTEEETRYLLGGKYSGKRAEALTKKLEKAGLDLSIFPRNLEVLLARRDHM